jgi:hypothetical protein
MGRLDLGRIDQAETSPIADEEAGGEVARLRHSVHARTYRTEQPWIIL